MRGLDLSIKVIKGLKVKGLQSCHLSNFENVLSQVILKHGPYMVANILAVMVEAADFF